MTSRKKASGSNGSAAPGPDFIRDLRVIVSALAPFVVIQYFVLTLSIKNMAGDLRYESSQRYAEKVEVERRLADVESHIQRVDDKTNINTASILRGPR